MKKNLITVVILAISIINLVFKILQRFLILRSLRRQRTTVHLMLAIWHITSWNREIQST